LSRMRLKHLPWRPRRGERASSSWLASRPSFDRRRSRRILTPSSTWEPGNAPRKSLSNFLIVCQR
jgi:hypothetical protein